MASKKQFARTFGQDLMRGEHIVRGGKVSNLLGMSDSNAAYMYGKKDYHAGNPVDTDAIKAAHPESSGTSIFDPVLCELAYRWFCPTAGIVLDPFAGGSVRGIVASHIGLQYIGIDLRPEQIAANREQAVRIAKDPQPVWITGDSRNIAALCPDVKADLVFSCPPYADLERYSDDPLDLSTMDYPAFIESYRAIIKASCAMLKSNRFACFVVGDIRDKKGFYRGFVSDTRQAFEDCGLHLYNDAVLVTAVGSLPIRVGKQFSGGRKLGKTHQNVLVFYNGDPKAIKTEFTGECQFGELTEDAVE